MRSSYLSCISSRFQLLSASYGQVTYVLLTRSPLKHRSASVRLACIRHAASVHPEPGSNSPKNFICFLFKVRSEEHTSELQSRPHLVCRLLLEKKNNNKYIL